MKVKRIVVEFEPDDSEIEKGHATRAEFTDGKWEANGPMFSRLHAALHQVWQLLREGRK